MSARGGCGMEINLDLVPMRESDMSPYEISLSESQERMLIVTEPQKLTTLMSIFSKWDLQSVQIGRVVAEDVVRYLKGGAVVAEIPATSLVAGRGAPVYRRETREPSYLKMTREFSSDQVPAPSDLHQAFLKLLGSPNIARKDWVYEQYDTAVQTSTTLGPGIDAAVMRLRGTEKLLAVTTDGNSRYVYLSPRTGGSIAVAEAARNIVSVGGRPLAITNCLNFGNPYDPEVYWQFSEAVAGIREACIALGAPVTGGNVSFYNEGPDGATFPTPVIGMIGIIDSIDFVTTPDFKDPGDVILLLGDTIGHIGGSEYLHVINGMTAGEAPSIDLQAELRLQRALLELITKRLVKSAHDLSDGGLAVALAESCIMSSPRLVGATIELPGSIGLDHMLFGEDQCRVLITALKSNLPNVLSVTAASRVPSYVIGHTGGAELTINRDLHLSLDELADTYCHSTDNFIDPGA
jgi:phosphoribosylformylglycinamidine synthase II